MSSSSAAETQLGTRQGRRKRCRYGATASPSSADSVVRNTAGLKCGRSMILLNHSGLKEAEAAVNQRGSGEGCWGGASRTRARTLEHSGLFCTPRVTNQWRREDEGKKKVKLLILLHMSILIGRSGSLAITKAPPRPDGIPGFGCASTHR